MEMWSSRVLAQDVELRSGSFFSHPPVSAQRIPHSLSPALAFVGLIIAKNHELCGDEGGSDVSCVFSQPGVMSQGSDRSGLKDRLCY